ncbi:unnamed protein product [Somion occarium]|uniref:Copper transport protein n=1 Tax=Somion occarium TaxID=3059160 RepID=A0ABP1CTV4_9APHY
MYSPHPHTLIFTLLALALLHPISCSENGMDMSMDGAMSLTTGQMLPYLHFTPGGDTLWFLGWVPTSAGAMVGTCIGLFLLGIVERWVAACRALMEIHWNKRAQIVRSDRLNARGLPVASEKAQPDLDLKHSLSSLTAKELKKAVTMRDVPPFILAHDLMRGILHVGQAGLQFAFMLAVMTFQVGFILSLVIGLGVGEMLFGRYASHAAHLA